jgi:hypothetical protein
MGRPCLRQTFDPGYHGAPDFVFDLDQPVRRGYTLPLTPYQEGHLMYEDIVIARARARKIAGEDAWNQFSEAAKNDAIDDEFRMIDDECRVARKLDGGSGLP